MKGNLQLSNSQAHWLDVTQCWTLAYHTGGPGFKLQKQAVTPRRALVRLCQEFRVQSPAFPMYPVNKQHLLVSAIMTATVNIVPIAPVFPRLIGYRGNSRCRTQHSVRDWAHRHSTLTPCPPPEIHSTTQGMPTSEARSKGSQGFYQDEDSGLEGQHLEDTGLLDPCASGDFF